VVFVTPFKGAHLTLSRLGLVQETERQGGYVRYFADDCREMSSGDVVGVVPVNHPARPLDRTWRATVDASRPQTELDAGRGARVFVTAWDKSGVSVFDFPAKKFVRVPVEDRVSDFLSVRTTLPSMSQLSSSSCQSMV
jgi:hypothetical protein